MGNIQKWKVMAWCDQAGRYFQEYITEFQDTMHGNEVRREVLRCDGNLKGGMTHLGAPETIVVRHEEG